MSELGQKLIEKVREHAEAQPDFSYSPPDGQDGCVYVNEGQPSCIVGHALWDNGLITAALESSDVEMEVGHETTILNNVPVSHLLLHYGLSKELTADEVMWLNKVQLFQDMGYTWSVSVSKADEFVYPEGTP